MFKTNKKKIIKTNLVILNILKNEKQFISKSISQNLNLSQKEIVLGRIRTKKTILKEVCMVSGKTKSLIKNFKINRLITNRFIQTNTIQNIISHSKQ